MIIPIEQARAIDPDIEEEELEALEHTIRGYTNNTFMDLRTRSAARITGENSVTAQSGNFEFLNPGDRIQITGSDYYDGLATIQGKQGNELQLDGVNFAEATGHLYITRVNYPPDVRVGAKKLLKYDAAQADRIGLKSRSVARMSETYADPSSGNFINGYPAGLFDFLNRHRRMRWD